MFRNSLLESFHFYLLGPLCESHLYWKEMRCWEKNISNKALSSNTVVKKKTMQLAHTLPIDDTK